MICSLAKSEALGTHPEGNHETLFTMIPLFSLSRGKVMGFKRDFISSSLILKKIHEHLFAARALWETETFVTK